MTCGRVNGSARCLRPEGHLGQHEWTAPDGFTFGWTDETCSDFPLEMRDLAERARLAGERDGPCDAALVLADWLEANGHGSLSNMVAMRGVGLRAVPGRSRAVQLDALSKILGRRADEPLRAIVDGELVFDDALVARVDPYRGVLVDDAEPGGTALHVVAEGTSLVGPSVSLVEWSPSFTAQARHGEIVLIQGLRSRTFFGVEGWWYRGEDGWWDGRKTLRFAIERVADWIPRVPGVHIDDRRWPGLEGSVGEGALTPDLFAPWRVRDEDS